MGIGKRIKEARENLGLTQSELGDLVGVTGSAITNYEKETSHPKEAVMYKLFECLHVDANYLFQDVVKVPPKTNDVTFSEYEHIKKYRSLDKSGQDHVDTVLAWEAEHKDQIDSLQNRLKEYSSEYLNAAHERADATAEEKAISDAIMMDDDEWK